MMFLFSLLIPIIMVVCGLLMYKFPPKKANAFVGYRTRRSRLNAATWLFSNQYCGKLWLILGFIMFVLSGIAAILFAITENDPDAVIPIVEAVEIIVLLGSIIPVEMKLKRNFDKSGNRR